MYSQKEIPFHWYFVYFVSTDTLNDRNRTKAISILISSRLVSGDVFRL